MKKTTIFILLFFVITSISAQLESKAFIVGCDLKQVKYKDYDRRIVGGLDLQFFVTDHISLNSNFSFGRDYVHMPLVSYFFSDFIIYNTFNIDEENWYMFLLITEGVSFHIKIAENLSISPYINPLCFEYIYQTSKQAEYDSTYTDYDPRYITGATGFRFNMVFARHLYLGTYAEAKLIYNQENTGGYAYGVNLGYCF